ncbi:hypothetical protein QUA08_29085, partial [Microcoleus sp. T3B2]
TIRERGRSHYNKKNAFYKTEMLPSILCGTGILPVADNGATSQFNQFNNYNLLLFLRVIRAFAVRLKKALFAHHPKKL